MFFLLFAQFYTSGLAVNLKETLEDSHFFRLVLVFWFASSLFIVVLLGRIDWIMHHELYNFGLYFSHVWADPYWFSLSLIYTCLAIPSLLSAVLLGLDVWRKTSGHKPPVESKAEPAGGSSQGFRDESILQLIRLVDRDFGAYWHNLFLRSDVGLPFILVGLVALVVFLLFSDAPNPQRYAVGLSVVGAALAFFSLRSSFIEEKMVDMNFKRLERYYWKCICSEREMKPLLKALVKMKSKHRGIDLEQIYRLNKSMFSEKELLERLYR